MKKAKIRLTPIDIEYQRLYGKYPDYDYESLVAQYGSDVGGVIRQERINHAWNNLKTQYKKMQDSLKAECPFPT